MHPVFQPSRSCLASTKSHTTVKGLVGMTPDGAVCFVSELFAGAISDRDLVIRSHFLDLLSAIGYGSSRMADKGFDIQDLLAPSGVKLNIPPFKKGGQQMASSDVQKTQHIAKVRIHIERLIERFKEFQIFAKGCPPHSLSFHQPDMDCLLLADALSNPADGNRVTTVTTSSVTATAHFCCACVSVFGDILYFLHNCTSIDLFPLYAFDI